MWFEEMINNRNKSVVRDMKWTADGTKICIVYEDGAVIVGSVDGNRLWGKELDFQLALVEWSPDSAYILFVSTDSRIFAFDAMGNKVKKLQLPIVDHPLCPPPRKKGGGPGVDVAAISWYDGAEGSADRNAPSLAIALANGLVQVSRGVDDPEPLVLETQLDPLTQCKWDSKGSVLAVAGLRRSEGAGKPSTVVQFYDAFGGLLRTLKVPGGGINALSWEGGGLRIALAVDAYIYFANIRPDYKWAFMPPPLGQSSRVGAPGGGTLCYAYTKPDKVDSSVMFWDTAADEKSVVTVKALRHLAASGSHAVLVTGPHVGGGFRVVLCDGTGAPLDERALPLGLVPAHCCMTAYHVFVGDRRFVYVWQYRTQQMAGGQAAVAVAAQKLMGRAAARERVLDVAMAERSVRQAGGVAAAIVAAQTVDAFAYPQARQADKEDPVVALCASETSLMIGLESGAVHRYGLPLVSLEQRYELGSAPSLLKLNCDSTLMAHVDGHGQLGLLDLLASQSHDKSPQKEAEEGGAQESVPVYLPSEDGGPAASGGKGGEKKGGEEEDDRRVFERKDCWDMIWSADHPRSLVTMEKTRMFMFEGLVAQEPTLSSGYLAWFEGGEVRAAMLDEVYAMPDRPSGATMMCDLEGQRLRAVRELLEAKGCTEAFAHVEAIERAVTSSSASSSASSSKRAAGQLFNFRANSL